MAERISNYDLQVYEREILPNLPPEVVDAHVLLGLREHFREVPSGGRATPELRVRHHLTVQGLFSNFKQILQHRKRRFVVLPFSYREVDVGAANSYVAESTRRGSLRALVALDGTNGASVRRLLERPGVVGAVVHLDFERGASLRALDEDILSLLIQKGGALMVFPPWRGAAEEGAMGELLSLALRYPSLKIVLARVGGALCPGAAERLVPALAEAPNIYFDTALVTSHKVLEILLSLVGPRRVIFGSGAPYSFYRGYVACPGGYSKLVILGRGGERHIPRSRSDTLLSPSRSLMSWCIWAWTPLPEYDSPEYEHIVRHL